MRVKVKVKGRVSGRDWVRFRVRVKVRVWVRVRVLARTRSGEAIKGLRVKILLRVVRVLKTNPLIRSTSNRSPTPVS